MSHDPMCEYGCTCDHCRGDVCTCYLVAAVRQRTLDEAVAAVTGLVHNYDPECPDGDCSTITAALAAITRLRQVAP